MPATYLNLQVSTLANKNDNYIKFILLAYFAFNDVAGLQKHFDKKLKVQYWLLSILKIVLQKPSKIKLK